VKKIFIVLMCAAALTGCASFWNAMGAASSDDVKAIKKSMDELSSLKAELDAIKASADEAKISAAKVDEVAKGLAAIQGRLDSLPKDTLQKLNDILDKALLELATDPYKTAPTPAPNGGK
jgi:hypothetical protein